MSNNDLKKENTELEKLAADLKYSEEKRKEINKIYKVKGHGKKNKLLTCRAISFELKKALRNCEGIKVMIEMVKDGIKNKYDLSGLDSVKDYPSVAKLKESYQRKIQKEFKMQDNIIKNKDFDALVKDVNKTIMAGKLFVVVMTKSIEEAADVNSKNYIEKFQTLNFLENSIEDSIKILERQYEFSNQQSQEIVSFLKGDRNVENEGDREL